MSKTCGECRFFNPTIITRNGYGMCTTGWLAGQHVDSWTKACDWSISGFKRQITNGDQIRQGDNRELAEFLWKLYNGHICSFCMFLVADDDRKQVICKRPPDKTCRDGIEAWLNAKAGEHQEIEE